MTTLFIGAYYEITNPGSGQTISKYYFAGSARIAMRKYAIPQNMKVEFFLSDHLGSTSVTTDFVGNKVSEIKYKPWGEARYSWTSETLTTTPTYEMTKYQFTGQFSYESEFGLQFYNARWYDSQTGRFAQADSIVPAGVQGYDRYAYTFNNPVRYVDPSGHEGCWQDESDYHCEHIRPNHQNSNGGGFTDEAIQNYLLGYCQGDSSCANTILGEWQSDAKWWDMIKTAQAGDNIFGTGTCCVVNGGLRTDFLFTFAGKGVNALSGFSNTTISLVDVQKGYYVYPTAGEMRQSFKWIGFFRTDSRGKPSFYAPGYEIKQTQWTWWATSGVDATPGMVIGGLLPGGGSLIQKLGSAVSGAGLTALIPTLSDVLNMEQTDTNVQIGPIFFNFQWHKNDTYSLE